MLLSKKPLRLKLLEPKIEAKYVKQILISSLNNIISLLRSKFDPRHHNTVISEKQLQAKRYKKEYKSAVKEIRKDNQFIAGVQFKENMDKLVFYNDCKFLKFYFLSILLGT